MKMSRFAVTMSAITLAAFSGTSWAGAISLDTSDIASGQQIQAAPMATRFQNIQTGVNGNATDIANLQSAVGNGSAGLVKDVNDLKATVGDASTGLVKDVSDLKSGQACVGNNPSDEMVRIGSLCVDKYRPGLWTSNAANATAHATMPGPCLADGSGCTTIFAQSRQNAGGAKTNAMSWAQAARACANANKRLLTAGEYMIALTVGSAVGMSTLDEDEYVDNVIQPGAPATPNPINTPISVGYMGPTTDAGGKVQIYYTQPDAANGSATFLYFRCAR